MPDSRSIYKAHVDAAIMFITEHLAEDLSLEDIAEAALFSSFHLHRIFRARFGNLTED